jgi:FkbM family methyltransferase
MKIRELCGVESRTAIEKWCRQQTQQCYLGDHTALARVLGNYLMYVDTRDLSLTPHMLMNGFWEMWVTQAVVSYVKPGMRCIDVGANCGYYTALLADLVGDKGFVQAYEPQVGLAKLLQKTITVNGMHQAQISTNIVGAHHGSAPLYLYKEHRGSASARPGKYAEEHPEECPMVSLDSEGFGFQECSPIDFVKIDVQGLEYDVLFGMRETIRRNPKLAIAMEFTPCDHADPDNVLAQIEGFGLTIRTIGTDGVVRPISRQEAAQADTGDHRMLWLSKG